MQKIEELISTAETRVAEFSLAANQAGEWHYHSAVVEYCYCLDGVIAVEQQGKQSLALKPGEKVEIVVGNVHRVCNVEAQPCRYLIIQGVGTYDFLQVEEP
ncbi:MAG: cupin domain-containing protein [Methylococcales bacterium]